MSEIKNLIEMLEKGGFRSACDWFCQKMDASHLRHLLKEMEEADSKISNPEQKKMFEQGILAIRMSLDSKENPNGKVEAGGDNQSEINHLVEMLEKGGFRSACDWLCLKMDASHLRHLLEEMKKADSTITEPEQKKMFEQGILAIQMSLDTNLNSGSKENFDVEPEGGERSLLVN